MKNGQISFEGKVAVVTGSTRGIGRAIADLLAKQGARVIYTGTKQDFKIDQPGSVYWPLDLSDDQSIHAFLEKLKTEPRVDILINNAGINKIEPIDEIKDENWERILKVNLTGTMYLMREVAKIMKKNKKGGKILNVSSIFGQISRAKRDSYSTSKAGMIGLTRASALDLAADNILVNAICPGFTLTDLTKSILSKQEMDALCEDIPLGRFADVNEIAEAAVFLCSDLNTYVTGQTITVDGGVLAK